MTNVQADLIVHYFQFQWGLAYPILIVEVFLFYLLYLAIKNPGLVDFAWEATQLTVGIIFYIKYDLTLGVRSLTFFILLFCWFARLGGFILVTRILTGEKDPRYEKLSQDSNPYVYFFINYQIQGFLATVVCTPLFFVFQPELQNELNWSYYLGVVMVSVGIIMEGVADYQLQQYKERRRKEITAAATNNNTNTNAILNEEKPSRKIFQEGLWKKSRHPNLFFELVIWFGFAFAGVNGAASALGFFGPISLTCIMVFLTIPLTEKHMRDTRPEYLEFCKQTNMLLIV